MRHVLKLVVVMAVIRPATLPAQEQFRVQHADGAALLLPDRRIAVVLPLAGRFVVQNLVGDAEGAAVDLRAGDAVLSLNGVSPADVVALGVHYNGLATGTAIELRVRRADTTVVVRFAKPAPRQGDGRTMVVTPQDAADVQGAGAWSTRMAPEAGPEMVLGGVHIRENAEGMPEVAYKTGDTGPVAAALSTGDVLTAINGRPIAALRGLQVRYGELPAGAEVVLEVTRGTARRTVTFKKPT
jgi:hypothetical protein